MKLVPSARVLRYLFRPKQQVFLVSNYLRQIKTGNLHIWKAGTSESLTHAAPSTVEAHGGKYSCTGLKYSFELVCWGVKLSINSQKKLRIWKLLPPLCCSVWVVSAQISNLTCVQLCDWQEVHWRGKYHFNYPESQMLFPPEVCYITSLSRPVQDILVIYRSGARSTKHLKGKSSS